MKLISDDILIDTGQELPINEATYPMFEGFNFGDPAAWTKGQPFELFKKMRGDTNTEHYFKEIIINSENLLHIFSRLKSNPTIIVTSVCRIDANLGLAVVKMREIANSETV